MLESIFPSIESDIFHLGKFPFDTLNRNKKSTRGLLRISLTYNIDYFNNKKKKKMENGLEKSKKLQKHWKIEG